MNNIINYFIESGLSMAVFSLFFILVLHREKSFVFNRFYLLGSVLTSLVLPLLHFSLGNIPAKVVAGTIILDTLELYNPAPSTTNITVDLVIWSYLSIMLILLLRIIYKSITLIRKNQHSIHMNGYKQVTLRNSTDAFTFLKTVYIGDQLSQEEQSLILSHERIHAKDSHTIDIIFLEIIAAVFWINPIYLLVKVLARTNHEYLADAKAIKGCSKDCYIQTLAAHTIQKHGFTLAHQFYTSSILKRIKMINQQNNQIMKIKQVIPFALGLALVIVFGCEDAAEQLSSMNDQEAANAIGKVQTSTVKEIEGMKGVYDMVEVQPGPEGGMTEFYQWIAENMKYPTQARKAGVEGRVFVQFIVNETGDITEVKSIKGIGAGCDAEAVRVMKSATKWTPGQVDGKPVSVRMVMPISFKLTRS